MTARLLFVGDIHLGRRPSRLPEHLRECGLLPAELSPAAAWRSTVDDAIARAVDAVVLAGDVIDRIEDRFEAYAPLRAGVERLVEAGIPVFAVAGNHDVHALPRLSRQIPEFELLGEGGRWQTVPVAAREGERVNLLGWSFPTERFRTSPLDSLSIEPAKGTATLGVLHCDVDSGASPYAPVSGADLRAAPVDAWLLGHIHKPDALDDAVPVGYLGSLSGLDPGEPGRHGPWLLEVDGPGRVQATQLPLAPLRYERCEVELTAPGGGTGAVEDIEDAAFHALTRGLGEVADRVEADDDGGTLRLVACRVRVAGPGRHDPAARAVLGLPERYPREQRSGVHYFVESVEESASPDLDLAAIAVGDDPPALLARRVLALQRGEPEGEALVARARQRLEATLSAPHWHRPATGEHAPEAIVDTLIRAGTRRLEQLLAQRDGFDAGATSSGANR